MDHNSTHNPLATGKPPRKHPPPTATTQPTFLIKKVSYSLLVFFCGIFVTVEGFNKTGIPSAMSDFMEPYAPIDHISDIAILAVVIVVLSNPASNVPTLLLLGARVVVAAATISPEKEKKAWLILAWVSTLAVNLSLLGSAANSIVCEQACRSQNYGYKSHLVVSSQVWCSFNNYSCSNRFDTYKSIKKHTPCDSI